MTRGVEEEAKGLKRKRQSSKKFLFNSMENDYSLFLINPIRSREL